MIGPLYVVADLDNPSPEPFAVLAVYPERREGAGCVAIVASLHMTREEANRVVQSAGSISETAQ